MKTTIPLLFLLAFICSTYAQVPNSQDLSKLSYAELDSLTDIEYNKGAYGKAIEYAQIGREKAKAEFGEQDSVFAEYTNYIGFCYHTAGQYRKAEQFYLQAKEIRANVLGKTHPNFAVSSMNLAVLYQKMGQYERAEPLLLEAKNNIKKALGEQEPLYALCLNNLAQLYKDMGQYEKAEPLILQTKNIVAKVSGEQHPNFGKSLNNLAALYQKMGQYEKAEPLFLQAISVQLKTLGGQHPSYASSVTNLAGLYKTMKQYEKAEPLFLQAKNIYAKVLGEQHPNFAISLNNLAGLYEAMGRYEKAVPLLLQSKNIRAKILGEQHPDFAASLTNLAIVYRNTSQYEKAELLLLEAKNIFSKTLGKQHPDCAGNLNTLAGLYLNMDKLDTALRYCQLAIIANCTSIDSSFNDWKSLDKLQYLSNEQTNISIQLFLTILDGQYKKTNNNNTLELHYAIAQAAIHLNQRIRNDFTGESDKLRSLAMNNGFVLNAIKTGVALKKQDYQETIFGFAEIDKGVLLMEAAKTERAYQFGDLPDSLASEERQLQKEYSNLKAKLLENRTTAEKDSLRGLLNGLNQKIDIVAKSLKNNYPKYAAIKYNNKTASITEIQALLNEKVDDKTALLEYVIGDSVIYIFYVDKKQVKLTSIYLSNNVLDEKIKDFHNTLSNYELAIKETAVSYQKYTENAFWFFENLVKPAISNAKNINKLLIVSDGELGHLPFEAFLTKAAPQKETDYHKLNYLSNDYKISYNYSATIWKAAKESTKNKNNGQILAMASNYDISIDSTKLDWRLPYEQDLRMPLLALPAAQKEIETLAESFNGSFAFGKDASEKNFKAKAGDYAIIHLAMHGLLDAKSPILSSLAFTEDSDSLENNFLHAYEISKMKLNADLVVLSACETGYGRFEKGNGIASLAQAFSYAGAPALIVSLWQVNDYATSEIMKNLYQNLADGMEKDEALQQAKIKYMKEAKGVMAHPAFWSPFILMGNTDAIYLKTKGAWFWWLVGGGIVALGLVGFLVRKKR